MLGGMRKMSRKIAGRSKSKSTGWKFLRHTLLTIYQYWETAWSRDQDVIGGRRKLKWCKALQFVLFIDYYDVKSMHYAVRAT